MFVFKALLLAGLPAFAQFQGGPEYRSAKADGTEVRAEPKAGAEVLWRLWKFMPVQVAAYRGDWLRVLDLDGDEGWVRKDALVEVPTVMVRGKEANLREKPGGKVVWILGRGYPLRVFGGRGDWLEVSDLYEVSGWVHKSVVWGAAKK